jgi:hypothetical protein
MCGHGNARLLDIKLRGENYRILNHFKLIPCLNLVRFRGRYVTFNALRTKLCPYDLNTQFVPRSKHFSASVIKTYKLIL